MQFMFFFLNPFKIMLLTWKARKNLKIKYVEEKEVPLSCSYVSCILYELSREILSLLWEFKLLGIASCIIYYTNMIIGK